MTISIVTRKGDRLVTFARHVDRKTLLKYSHYARRQLEPYGRHGGAPRIITDTVSLRYDLIDEKSVHTIIRWLESQDPASPRPLTLYDCEGDDGLGPRFDECLLVLMTCFAFQLDYALRGDHLREAILEYIRDLPLALSEFILIVECMTKDPAIIDIAMREVMSRQVKGGIHACPEFEGIKQYCLANFLWPKMLKIGDEILRAMGNKE